MQRIVAVWGNQRLASTREAAGASALASSALASSALASSAPPEPPPASQGAEPPRGPPPGGAASRPPDALSAPTIPRGLGASTHGPYAPAEPMRLHERIGPYEVERLISVGMSLVYRASAPDGRAVVVKTPNPIGATPVEWEHFGIEQAIRLRHPNIVQVLDAGIDPAGVAYLALELLEGETLAQRMHRQGLAPRALVQVARALCRALCAVHRAGIIHRDVKPANVFLCRDGTVKLIDFGIAHHPRLRRASTTGSPLGTVLYVSPEQARGEPDLDARSDLWSLGALLYEGLSGRPPYARLAESQVLFARLYSDATPVREVAPAVPPALARIVDRCLAREREARFPSALALAGALHRCEDHGLPDPPPGDPAATGA